MDNHYLKKITIVIPTLYYRDYKLLRLLKYLEQQKYNLNIRILISGELDKMPKQVKEIVKNLNIDYLEFSQKISTANKFNQGIQTINTPYIVLCADDDFIIPGNLIDSIKYLEDNPDYSTAHGRYISYWQPGHPGQPEGHFIIKDRYESKSVTDEKAVDRFLYHFENYSWHCNYSVHRTDLLKIIFNNLVEYTNDIRFEELIYSLSTLSYGKMKRFNTLHCMREKPLPYEKKTYSDDIFDFQKKGTYNEKYSNFKKCMAGLLSNLDGISITDAENVVDRGMNTYLSNALQNRKIPIKQKYKLKLIYLSEKFKLMYYLKRFYKKTFLYKKAEPNEYLDWFSAEDLKEFNKIKSLVLKYHDYK
jgi:glycosyltransferase domain-containing protein